MEFIADISFLYCEIIADELCTSDSLSQYNDDVVRITTITIFVIDQ